MKIMARHLTIDMYGCKVNRLTSFIESEEALVNLLSEANITLTDSKIQTSDDNEITALYFLNVGHMSIHYYPQLNYAAVDIYVCSENAKPEKAISSIRSIIKPERTKTTYLKRGDFGSVKDMKPKIKVRVAPLRKIRNTGAKMMNLIKN